MLIPTQRECCDLICEMEMMEHIVAHSVQVCRVALFLVDRLRETGLDLDRGMVEAASLLHDITKTRSFETGEMHTETGGRLLKDRGFFEVGEIIRQHVKLDAYFAGETPDEAEIVNYADKRVLHDRIVSMAERMAYILERYGRREDYRQRLAWLWKKSEEMERRIFAGLPFGPGRIESMDLGSGIDEDFEEHRALLEAKAKLDKRQVLKKG